jgi:hypothetical protein
MKSQAVNCLRKRGNSTFATLSRLFVLIYRSPVEILTSRFQNHRIAAIFKRQEQLICKSQGFVEALLGHNEINQQLLIGPQIAGFILIASFFKKSFDAINQWMLAQTLCLRP